MKKLLIIPLLAVSIFVQAQNVTLVVNIKNFKNDEGIAYVSLQDPTKKPVQQQAAKIVGSVSQVVFKDVPLGQYVVRLFHDENGNKKLDTGFFGMPKEGWGVSNDVKAHFGPPKFEDMIFALDKDKTISITMN